MKTSGNALRFPQCARALAGFFGMPALVHHPHANRVGRDGWAQGAALVAVILGSWLSWQLPPAFGEEPLSADAPRVLVVVGAAGAPEYATAFRQWADRWQQACQRSRGVCQVIGLDPPSDMSDRERLKAALTSLVGDSRQPAWIVLLGHGTYNGRVARFNLQGPDVSASDLSQWLSDVTRPTVIVDCSACSGPFLAELSGPQRVIVTATQSGHEYNYARYGDYLSAAIADPSADLDKDEQTSLWEAYLVAGARLREFYARSARLATEHPLLDDNADRRGTPADWFQGLRPVKRPPEGGQLDGALARQLVLAPAAREQQFTREQVERRDELEREIAALRSRRATLEEAEYFRQLEPLLVELARLYRP